MPLWDWLEAVRPAFIALAIIYWGIYAPHAGGIFAAWAAGLAFDVFNGEVLGQNALAVSDRRLHRGDAAPAAARTRP